MMTQACSRLPRVGHRGGARTVREQNEGRRLRPRAQHRAGYPSVVTSFPPSTHPCIFRYRPTKEIYMVVQKRLYRRGQPRQLDPCHDTSFPRKRHRNHRIHGSRTAAPGTRGWRPPCGRATSDAVRRGTARGVGRPCTRTSRHSRGMLAQVAVLSKTCSDQREAR